jgi:hypothetical protein
MNAFTNPEMFKINIKDINRSTKNAIGGRARAQEMSGQTIPGMGGRDLEKTRINWKKPKK